jgi:hypothetical protein
VGTLPPSDRVLFADPLANTVNGCWIVHNITAAGTKRWRFEVRQSANVKLKKLLIWRGKTSEKEVAKEIGGGIQEA